MHTQTHPQTHIHTYTHEHTHIQAYGFTALLVGVSVNCVCGAIERFGVLGSFCCSIACELSIPVVIGMVDGLRRIGMGPFSRIKFAVFCRRDIFVA